MTGPAPERPLRVLHLCHPVDGGVAQVVVAVAADQDRRGWDVVVGCPADGELPAALRARGVSHVGWQAEKVKRMAAPRRVREVARLIARIDPDVVHLHSASAGLAGRLAVRRRRPTIFQPHGWTWQSAGGLFGRAAQQWERVGERLADAVVCVSEAELAAGREHGLALSAGVVIPNGVDLARFPAQSADSRAEARARLGLADVPTVVVVGRLDEQKGQHVLLAAWPTVLARVPTARLVLVGTGPAQAALAGTAEALGGSVLMAGARSDIPDWYAAADVVAFASTHGEGMPLTPIEAQASARALVASDLPGVRECMAEGGGALVPPGDASAFAAALAERLLDPTRAADEGRSGHAQVAERFDVRGSLERTAALTEQVAGRRPRPVRAG